MSYLYYSNLPGVRYPEGFMQRAQNGFWPFDTYLYQAIKRLEKERLIVKFTLISQEIENYNEEKTNFDEREETVEKQINQIIEEENSEENQEDSTLSSASNVTVVGIVKKVWIEIHPASNDEENARELMDEFLKQKYVYDTEKCERTKRIKVLERKIKKNR